MNVLVPWFLYEFIIKREGEWYFLLYSPFIFIRLINKDRKSLNMLKLITKLKDKTIFINRKKMIKIKVKKVKIEYVSFK